MRHPIPSFEFSQATNQKKDYHKQQNYKLLDDQKQEANTWFPKFICLVHNLKSSSFYNTFCKIYAFDFMAVNLL